MTEKIDYYDEQLALEIKRIFGNSYGAFQPIVIDVLLRRKYAFNISKEECINEAVRFINNCDNITFKKLDNFLGLAYSTERKIEINSKYLNRNMDKESLLDIYDTIAHEISHSLSYHTNSYNENGFLVREDMTESKVRELSSWSNQTNSKLKKDIVISCGLQEYDPDWNQVSLYGEAWMEANNEAAASLTIFDRKNEYTSNIERGYGQFSRLIPHLFSAAIGVSDRKLIGAGIKGADFYDDVIKKQFKNEDFKCITNDMMKINFSLDTLKAIYYSTPKQNEKKQSVLAKRHLAQAAMKNIGQSCFSIASTQIENDPREISQEMAFDIITRYEKMEKVLTDSYRNTSLFNRIKLQRELSPYKQKVMDKAFGIYLISKNKERLGNDFKNLSKAARKGEIYDLQGYLKENYMIDIENEQISLLDVMSEYKKDTLSPYFEMLKKEDTNDGKEWDNEKITKEIQEVVDRVMDIKNSKNTPLPLETKTFAKIFLREYYNDNSSWLSIGQIFDAINNKYGIKMSIPPQNYDYLFRNDFMIKNNSSMFSNAVFDQSGGISNSDVVSLKEQNVYLYFKNIEGQLDLVEKIVDNAKLYYGDYSSNSKKGINDRIFETSSSLKFVESKFKHDIGKYEKEQIPKVDQQEYKKEQVDFKFKKIQNKLLFDFIKNELRNKGLPKNITEIDDAIENGNFEETFNILKKQYGIRRSLGYYKARFEYKRRIYQSKQKVNASLHRIQHNRTKSLPSISNGSTLKSASVYEKDSVHHKSSRHFRDNLAEYIEDPTQILENEYNNGSIYSPNEIEEENIDIDDRKDLY